MTVYIGDFNGIEAQGYPREEQDDIRHFIRKFGEDYDSLTDLLDDWSNQ